MDGKFNLASLFYVRSLIWWFSYGEWFGMAGSIAWIDGGGWMDGWMGMDHVDTMKMRRQDKTGRDQKLMIMNEEHAGSYIWGGICKIDGCWFGSWFGFVLVCIVGVFLYMHVFVSGWYLGLSAGGWTGVEG